ncbi:methyltransferase [Mariniphaga sediminis]|uniref:Methyltransferase n=1 Tax=Mariniphaga sediminis TaxID=1628158 RepID=A0A399D7Q8_9BACT|nr:class I SAM-dependent methyltransferase [Mariniphaga sediminis]RIH66631.1 methyltransferase [Mariniphaga sediminis]
MKLKYVAVAVLIFGVFFAKAQYPEIKTNLDRKVKTFLEENVNNWRDMNVPISDGKTLYDIIVENNYTKAVEIGTSTGHSAIWIAWALSKTGGKLITIEIDKKRWLEAKANFKKAGVDKFIDARLADAHDLVPSLPGKYDFVFSDADKYWYKNYFVTMDPKLKVGGCFTAHNTSMRISGIREFVEYIESLDYYKTSYVRNSRSGISISYKKAEKPETN